MVIVRLQMAQSPISYDEKYAISVSFDQASQHLVYLNSSMTREQVSEALLNLAEKVLQS